MLDSKPILAQVHELYVLVNKLEAVKKIPKISKFVQLIKTCHLYGKAI